MKKAIVICSCSVILLLGLFILASVMLTLISVFGTANYTLGNFVCWKHGCEWIPKTIDGLTLIAWGLGTYIIHNKIMSMSDEEI